MSKVLDFHGKVCQSDCQTADVKDVKVCQTVKASAGVKVCHNLDIALTCPARAGADCVCMSKYVKDVSNV